MSFNSVAGGGGTPSEVTELPAAATPGDAETNATPLSQIIARLQGYSGSTWNRLRAGLTTIGTFTGILNTAPYAQYNTTPTTRTDGQGGPFEADTSGNLKFVEQFVPAAEDNTNGVIATQIKPLAVATYSPSLYTNFASQVTQNIKATAGNLLSFSAHNTNNSPRYLQFHNTATTPGGAAVPLLTFWMPGLSSLALGREFFSEAGIRFSTGIAMAMSTTEGTYTAGAAGDVGNLLVTYI